MSKNILDFFGQGKYNAGNGPIDVDEAISMAVMEENNFDLDVSSLQSED